MNNFEVHYLPSAINDLDEIIDYIKIDSPKAALRILNEIDESIDNLSRFPMVGIIPKDKRLKRLGYRILIVNNYLVFYTIKDIKIEIRRILHSKRDYKFLL
jgi:toxin ParE1/3/4